MQFHRLMIIIPLLVVLIMMIDGMPSRKRKTNKRNSKNVSNQNQGKHIQWEEDESSNKSEPVSESVPTQEEEKMSYAQSLVRGTSSGSSVTTMRSQSDSKTTLDESFLKAVDQTIKETLTKKLTEFLREQDPNLRNKLLTPLLSANTRLELQKKLMPSSSNNFPEDTTNHSGSSASPATEGRSGPPGTSLDQRVLDAIDQAVIKGLAERFRLSHSIKSSISTSSPPNTFPPQFGTLSPKLFRDPQFGTFEDPPQFGTLSPKLFRDPQFGTFVDPPQFGTLSPKSFGEDSMKSSSPNSLRQLNELLANRAANLRRENVNKTGTRGASQFPERPDISIEEQANRGYQQNSNKKIEHLTSSAEISSSGLQYNESVMKAIDEAVQQTLSRKLETFSSLNLNNSSAVRHKSDARASSEAVKVSEDTPSSLGVQQIMSETNTEIQQEEKILVLSELEQNKPVGADEFLTSTAHMANKEEEDIASAQVLKEGTDYSIPIDVGANLYNTQQTLSDESRSKDDHPSISSLIYTNGEKAADIKSSTPSEAPVKPLSELDHPTTEPISVSKLDVRSSEREEKSSTPSEEPPSPHGLISELDDSSKLTISVPINRGKEVDVSKSFEEERRSPTPSEESELDHPSKSPKSVSSNEQNEKVDIKLFEEAHRSSLHSSKTSSEESHTEINLQSMLPTSDKANEEREISIKSSGKDKESISSTEGLLLKTSLPEVGHLSKIPISITANEEMVMDITSPVDNEKPFVPVEILLSNTPSSESLPELNHTSEATSMPANVVQDMDIKPFQGEEKSLIPSEILPSKTPLSESLFDLDHPSGPIPMLANVVQEIDIKLHEDEEKSSPSTSPSFKPLSELGHPSEPTPMPANRAPEMHIKPHEEEEKWSPSKSPSSESFSDLDRPTEPTSMPANVVHKIHIKPHEKEEKSPSKSSSSKSLSDLDRASKPTSVPADVVQDMDIKPFEREEKSFPSTSPLSKSLSELDHFAGPTPMPANMAQEIDIKPHKEEERSPSKTPLSESLSDLDHPFEPTLMPANVAQEIHIKSHEEEEESSLPSRTPSSESLSKLDHPSEPTSIPVNVVQEMDIKPFEEDKNSSIPSEILRSKNLSSKSLFELDHPSKATSMPANMGQEIDTKPHNEEKENPSLLSESLSELNCPSEATSIPANVVQEMDTKLLEEEEKSSESPQTKILSSTEAKLLEFSQKHVESSRRRGKIRSNEIPPEEISKNKSHEESSLVDSAIPKIREENIEIEKDDKKSESCPAFPIMESKINILPQESDTAQTFQTKSDTFNLTEMFPSIPATTEDYSTTDSMSQQNKKKLARQMSYIQALMKESKNTPRKGGFTKVTPQPRLNETSEIAAEISVSNENEAVQSLPTDESLHDASPQPGETSRIKIESQDPLSAESIPKTQTFPVQDKFPLQTAPEEKVSELSHNHELPDKEDIISLPPHPEDTLTETSAPRQMTIQTARWESKDVMTSPDSLDQYGSAKSVISDISFGDTSSDKSSDSISSREEFIPSEFIPQIESEIEGENFTEHTLNKIPETRERKEAPDANEMKGSFEKGSHLEIKNVEPILNEAPKQIIHQEKPLHTIDTDKERQKNSAEHTSNTIPETIERKEPDDGELEDSSEKGSHLEINNVEPILNEAPKQIIHQEEPLHTIDTDKERQKNSAEHTFNKIPETIERKEPDDDEMKNSSEKGSPLETKNVKPTLNEAPEQTIHQEKPLHTIKEGQENKIPETIEREDKADNSETKESSEEGSHLEKLNEAPRQTIRLEKPLHTLGTDEDQQKSAPKTSTSYAQALMTGLARENSSISNPNQLTKIAETPLPSSPSKTLDKTFLAAIDLNVKLILSQILPDVPGQKLLGNFRTNYSDIHNMTVNQEEEIGEEDFSIDDDDFSKGEIISPGHTYKSGTLPDDIQSTGMLVKPATENVNLLTELKRLKINPKNLGINTVLFQPKSVFFKCNSSQEAENLRKIITESGTLIYELNGTHPCSVSISNIPNDVTIEELAYDIFLTFNEHPKKILFFIRTASFKNAFVLVSSSLLKKMEESPEVRIRWHPHKIDTSLRSTRCHNCHLLGHISKHCDRPLGPRIEFSKPCVDCMYQNESSQMAGFSNDAFKDINHLTNHDECPTKLAYRSKILWDANY